MTEDSNFLPNPETCRVDETKITSYLMNETHEEGGPKAKFFQSVGFKNPCLNDFKAMLLTHAKVNPIAKTESHNYGTKFIIDCNVSMPNGKMYCIRTVWNDHHDGQPPRLITAHPNN